ncbi:hypothetical protein Tco_0656605, partial [Tanacetum coccineum]
NTMAEQNVPNQPPTRTDEQIVPRSQWLTIGKSNLLFNAQKIQKNPIFQISVDILSNTNFFQAFTASANVPAIYLQQFWNTMKYNEKTGVYSCQVDEQWFDLSADLLRKALAITPVIPAQPFELPPSGNTVIDFVNELGYPEPVEIDKRILAVTKPRHQFCKCCGESSLKLMLIHCRVCLWEEYYSRDPDIFLTHKQSYQHPSKVTLILMFILLRNGDDFILGNLKFVPKGESVEVFGMAIPDPLITEAIQQSSYYPKYLEMVAENTKKTPQESASVQPATKHKGISMLSKLVDEDDEAQQESIPQEEGDDPDLEMAKKMSLEAHQEKGEGEGDDADMERAIKLSLDPAFLPQGQAPVGGVTIRDPVSETTPKLTEVVGKGKVIVTEEQVAQFMILSVKKKKETTVQLYLVGRVNHLHGFQDNWTLFST